MKKALIALSALLVAVVSCNKTADLENKINDLDKRVSVLEEKVKEINEKTVPGLQATVAAVQAGVTVTSVVKDPSGYTITFSNGTTAVITNGQDGKDGENGKDGVKGDKGENPVISAKMDNGEFYWTVDGEFLLDAEGNKIPVHAATPQFRINEGKWEISYDGGATWTVVEKMGTAETGSISIEDKEDVVIFWIGETPYTVQKESTFCLVIDGTKDIGVPAGAVISIPYTVKGAKDGDEVEVEIFNVLGEWEATITRTSNVAGTIKAAPKGETVTDGKVFVYAANGNGKTDIKCLYFEEGKLSVITDAEKFEIPAEGGEFAIAVETNMSYGIKATNGGTSWIALAPSTKATHVDSVKFIVMPNTGAPRSSQISIVHPVSGDPVYTVSILQDGFVTKYEDYLGKWILGESLITISAKTDSTFTVSGLFTIGTKYGVSDVEAGYDKTTGEMFVMEQVLGHWMNSSDPCSTYLSGIFASNSKFYPHYTGNGSNSSTPYVIFKGNVKDGVATFSACNSKYNTPFNAYCVRWSKDSAPTSGNWLYNKTNNSVSPATIDIVNLPFQMTKAKEASEVYKSWLGNYELNGVYSKADSVFVISVVENLPDESYIINGLGIDGAPLMFDAATGNPYFKFGPFSSNSTYEFYVGGITNDNYISTGPASGVIASFRKAEDGSISIISDPWDVSESRKNVNTASLTILGRKVADGGWVTFTDCFQVSLPATVKRVSKSASTQCCSAYCELVETACVEE